MISMMYNIKRRCWRLVAYICCFICNDNGRANHQHVAAAFVSFTRSCQSYKKCFKLFSSVDFDVPPPGETEKNERKSLNQNKNLLIWKDVLPISLFTTICLVGAVIVSTYEDFDVTHTRPNPSTLRLPTDSTRSSRVFDASSVPVTKNKINFIGAATKGMGSGQADRLAQTFDDWYGTSATTLQNVRSYNEIMLEHRRERVPRWTGRNNSKDSDLGLMNSDKSSRISFASQKEARSYSKHELQDAVVQLYKSLDELDELKKMSDDYMWEEIKDMLQPSTVSSTLRQSLESMDILKAAPLYYKSMIGNNNQLQQLTTASINRNNVDQLPELIGFDWGSCAWRHCGAKADAQEALAELYTSVGMLEPFECRFIIDIIERSIRDVLLVVPDDLRPTSADGRMVELKMYEPYMSQADQGGDDSGMGIDFEYVQALNSLREVE